MPTTHSWRKSSYSPNAGNCVYVRNDRDGSLRLRESDAPDTVLTTNRTTFDTFIRAAKAGHFDRLTTT
ncbi:conserved hypothetical protein [Streptomyces himastatinicus ATCC 53653]|uniref:DUF397 domain-containing protein n=1 Tax=Streptomyces himastatinicus ATCC 53653 TaxID=457427 RepID=D9WLT0_9ACTN|nr:DUF397 domain-containing protein [Streptomyces himastatinicus]EFL23670.1 conserved hypothetical protein [Streptomyces himastatinicus ATCC 53653]